MRKLAKLIPAIFLFGVLVFGAGVVEAAVPHLINYQGKLTDTDGRPLEGAYDLTFKIYDGETAGDLLWEETQAGVVIQRGVFSILLGSVTDLDLAFDTQYWLAIKVGTDSEMTPRQRIASVGYAIRAEMAEDVVSVPRGVIVMWSGRIQNIPQGWALCDGSNDTPNLTDRFVIHADADSGGTNDVGDTGGAQTHVLSTGELPAHTHGSVGDHTHIAVTWGANPAGPFKIGSNQLSRIQRDIPTLGAGGHTHTSVGSGTAHENRPKFYALAYIMKI